MFALVCLIVLLIILKFYHYKHKRKHMVRMINKIPGPKSYPVIGSCLIFFSTPRSEKLKLTLSFHNRFGSLYKVWLGPFPSVHITKPEDAEVILASRKNINKAFGYNFFEPWLGTGLLTSSGSKWARRRKMLTPSFHFSILQTFFDVFVENSQVFVEKLEKEIKSEEFDIFPYIKNCTLDIICGILPKVLSKRKSNYSDRNLEAAREAAMGVKINAQEQPSEYTKSVEAWPKIDNFDELDNICSFSGLIVDYVTGAESMQLTRAEFEERVVAERLKLPELIALLSKPVTINELIHERIYSPWIWSNFFHSFSEHYRKQSKAIKVLHDMSLNVIRQRKQQRQKNQDIRNVENQFVDLGRKQKKMFLDLLLDVSEQLTEQLSEADIREEVDTFMFEGHDTTSAAVGWTIYLLGRHPNIQDKVTEELNAVFGSSDRPPTLDDLTELKYLECVIKETLRLFPSVPFIARTLTEDVRMSGYTIPKGTTVRINIYQLHRNPDHFKDPDKFNPANFTPEAIQRRHPFCYVPFSAGSRNCIGQKFAIMEEKVILSTFFRKYRVEAHQKYEDLKLIAESIIHSEEGILIKISNRT